MSKIKRTLALLLCLCMVLSYLPVHGHADGSESKSNVVLSVDKTEVQPGDTVTVTLSYTDMSVISFAAGIRFDLDKLECTEIVGARTNSDRLKNNGYLLDIDETWVKATAMSNTNQANANGQVGFAYAGTDEWDYIGSVLFTATFVVKEGVSGTLTFGTYEDSNGTDGYKNKDADGNNVTITTTTVTIGSSCEHTSTKLVSNGNGKHNVVCADDTCGAIVTENVTCSGTDDRDCTTDDTCACGYVVTAAKDSHTGGTNTCTEAAKCVDCGTEYISALGHKDDNKDHTCDNGCGVVQGEHKSNAQYSCLDGICEYCEQTIPANASHTDVEGQDHTCDVCGTVNVTDHTAGEPVVTTTPSTCTEGGSVVTETFCTKCGKRLTYNSESIPAGSDCELGEPAYTWADGYSSCTAEVKCQKGTVHKSETVNTTSEITTPGTCSEEEVTTYTASFEADWAVDQTREVTGEMDPNNHAGELSYEYVNDLTHKVACTACGVEVLEEEHNWLDMFCSCGAFYVSLRFSDVSFYPDEESGSYWIGMFLHPSHCDTGFEDTWKLYPVSGYEKIGFRYWNYDTGESYEALDIEYLTIPAEYVTEYYYALLEENSDSIVMEVYAYNDLFIDLNGGSLTDEAEEKYGSRYDSEKNVIILPLHSMASLPLIQYEGVIVRDGYQLTGFYDSANDKTYALTDELTSSETTTLVAQWQCLHSTTTAVDNGDGTHNVVCGTCGEVSESNVDHTFDETTHECVCGAIEAVDVASVTINDEDFYYTDLDSAINAVSSATAADNAVVTILQDIVLLSYQEITSGVFTIDLNGCEISAQYTCLSITGSETNVTIMDSIGSGKITSIQDNGIVVTGAALTISGGTVSAGYYGVMANTDSIVTISGGSVSGDEAGVNGWYCNVTISGGSISSSINGSGIEVSNTIVNISGGSISGGSSKDIRSRSSTITLTVGEGDTGATFPGGISVYGTTLAEILGDGAAYWQGATMITPAESATEITGDVVIKKACDHTNGFYANNGENHTLSCSDCGTSLTEDHVDGDDGNHDCDECGAANIEDHTEEVIPAITPTCTTVGATTGTKCSECGEVLVQQTVIDALGHGNTNGFEYTDLGDGNHSVTCKDCDVVTITSEPHTFDETTHECVCGAIEAVDVASVTINDEDFYYTDLDSAINAVSSATAADNAVVTILQNIDLGTNHQTISSGYFTIDLNGFEISCQQAGWGALFIEGSETNVTIKDSGTTGKITGDYGLEIYSATVTISGGTISGEYLGVVAKQNSTVTISDGTVNNRVDAEDSEVTISGGTVSSNNDGVYAKKSEVTISGGSISGNNGGVYASYSDVTISGGSISGEYDIYTDNSTVTLTVGEDGTGATFPGGISVGGTTLNAILGDDAGYWQGATMITPAVGEIEITGGDVVIKTACVHTNGSYTDNGEDHTFTCSDCGTSLTDDHTYDETTHSCVCNAVETFTLSAYSFISGEEWVESVSYGANLWEVLTNASDSGLIPSISGHRIEDDWFNGEIVVTGYSYLDNSNNWTFIDENTTMPGHDVSLSIDGYEIGWYTLVDAGVVYVNVDDVLEAGWHYIEKDYDDDDDGAWYYFYAGTGDWEGLGFRAAGLTRAPYPTEQIDGVTYAPDAEALAYCQSKGETFVDATEAWFYFDENGKFQSDMTGIVAHPVLEDANSYVVKGMLAWHPGLVNLGEYLYFIGDETNGGNIAANGDTYITRNNGIDDFVVGHIYNFVNGPLSGYNGIVDGKYYENSRLMAGNGLTKVGVNYIYVRSNGYIVVDAEYYVPANDLGIVSGTYTFDADGYLVNPKLTDKNGIIEENGVLYFYENGKLAYNKGLIEYNGRTIYVKSNGQLAVGEYYVTNLTNYEGSAVKYGDKVTFGADGYMIAKSGIVNGYYYVNNQIAYNAGVVKIQEGVYIYVRSNGQVVMNRNYWITNVGDSGLVAKQYTFDENGVMLAPEFVADQNNGIVNGYYYENGKIAYGAGLIAYNGGYIYVRSNGMVATGKYWVTNTNGLMDSNYYTFGENGMMIN